MDTLIFRRVRVDELPIVEEMQISVFHGEQGIPKDAVSGFLNYAPICWCAEYNGKICGFVAAWKENQKVHWGRFIVIPEMRGMQIGKRLAQYSFDEIFAGSTEEIYMEARDITVRIVCSMGGEIVGETVEFYKGTVTPVVLKKENYRCNR